MQLVVCAACLEPMCSAGLRPGPNQSPPLCLAAAQSSNTMAFPVPAISPAWSLFCQRALIQHNSFTCHARAHRARTPHTEPIRLPPHRQTQSLGHATWHSLIDAAQVFILSVCFYSAQLICMLPDSPAETWALNEHPLQVCCQLRQPGQTARMGGNHRLRIWIRDGSSARLTGPWLLLF